MTPAWLSVTSGGAGTGNGSVAYSIAPNPGAARTATLIIGAAIFAVEQGAAPCVYAVSPARMTFPGAGGGGSFTVIASHGGCPWSAVTNAPGWLTITAGESGSGEGVVQFTVADNPGERRVGTISAGGRSFTVTQNAHGPKVRRHL